MTRLRQRGPDARFHGIAADSDAPDELPGESLLDQKLRLLAFLDLGIPGIGRRDGLPIQLVEPIQSGQ